MPDRPHVLSLVVKKLFLVAAPASLVTLCLIAALVETWVRLTWDPMKGRPGFYVPDPDRFERLAPDYEGWFAGVPVHINKLGFRDTREYSLEKNPRTFRIVVLGDSVTFGHGSVYERTYPYLLEQHLKAWRPSIDWQVWNLGVPGYNTSQELATLLSIGPRFRPDLVVVGFFQNDIVGNTELKPPTRLQMLESAVKTWPSRSLYSYDWYRKQYLNVRYRFMSSEDERVMLEHLAAQEALLSRLVEVADRKEQQLTNPKPLPEGANRPRCTVAPPASFSRGRQESAPGFDLWKKTAARFQQLNREDQYRIVFFVNAAPVICQTEDLFVGDDTKRLDDFFLEILSAGTAAVSSHDGFLRYRPSDMPGAGGHSLGNAKAVKAQVLFDFLKDRILPPLLAKRTT